MRRPLAALALLWPLAAPAQQAPNAPAGLPEIPPNIEDFRLCRVALIFHLETGFWEKARYPRPVAETLLEQIHFVMAEYLFGTLSDSVETSVARTRFAERFFIDNAEIMRDRGEALRDLETREEIIDGCVGSIWETVRFEIDRLLRERRALTGLPGAVPHARNGPR